MAAYYPAFLDVRGRRCVVIGGGAVGERKVLGLLECDAQVIVISPGVRDGVRDLAAAGRVTWLRRGYRPGDLAGAFIAIAATEDTEVNRRVASEAGERNVLLNVVDVTDLCTFIAPSVARRGAVAIAASTGGASPALARRLRQEIQRSRLLDLADLAPILASARSEVRRRGLRLNSDHWQASMTDRVMTLLRAGATQEAADLLMANLEMGGRCDCPPDACLMWDEETFTSRLGEGLA